MLKKIKGFTLIEMIVVIGILMFMAILIIPSYRSYSRRDQLRESAQLVRSAIIEAQNTALASKDTKGMGGSWQYGAKKVPGTETLVVYKQQGTNITNLKTYTLPSSITWASDDWNIAFTPYNTPYNAPVSTWTNPNIRLKIKGTSDFTTISVNPSSGQTNITTP